MPSYLAFDLGASSGRAMLGTLEHDRMQLDELHRFPTPLVERDGHLFWDLEAIWQELLAGLREARRAAPALRSVSVNSWGVDYVPVDDGGRPLRDAYAYRDPRHAGMMARAFERVPREEIYRITGIQFMEINSVYQLMADREQEPDLFRRTASRLPIADYFNERFSGAAVAEVSLASTTQLMDVHTRRWSTELMRRLGLESAAWPRIVPSGTRLGPIRTAVVEGMAAPIDVVASCSHDTACAVAATPGQPETRWAYLSCGSWSLLGVERDTPLLSDAACAASYTNEAGLDGTIRFLKNLNGLWVLQECEREWKEAGIRYTYEALLDEARAAPSPGLFVDLNDEGFGLRGGMVDRVRAWCRRAGGRVPETRGDVVRAILESLAHSYGATLRTLEDLVGHPVDVLHVVGGGAQNALLCQWTADACGIPVVAGPVEATALGNLLVQARTMGDLPGGRPIREIVRAGTTLDRYTPQPNTVLGKRVAL